MDYIIILNLFGYINGEFMVSKKFWDKFGLDYKKVVEQCVWVMFVESVVYFLDWDYKKIVIFIEKMGKNVFCINDDVILIFCVKFMEVVDEYFVVDFKYSGRIGVFLYEFMKIIGKI